MKSASKADAVPDSPPALLVFGLMRAQEWFIESVRLTNAALGWPTLSAAQAMLIGHIAQGEHRPARLSRAIGMSRQAVSVLIAEFVRERVLKTEADPEDARALWVDFTPEHLPRRDATSRILQELERRVGHVIGEDRLGVLRQSLNMDWGPPLQLDAKAVGQDSSTKRSHAHRSHK